MKRKYPFPKLYLTCKANIAPFIKSLNALNFPKITFGIILLTTLFSLHASAQIVMSTGSTTTCSDMFYDSGGPTSGYSRRESLTHTIYPATIGSPVKVEFSSFSVGGVATALEIFDGNSTSAPLIGSYATTSPGTVISSATDGSLTFRFRSTRFSTLLSGWEATVSCVPVCSGTPTAGAAIASTTTACLGTPVLFSLTGASTELGLNYAWDSSSSSAGGWAAIGGATSKTLSFEPPIGRTLYYRCTITCTYSGSSATSTSVAVTGGTPLSLPYNETFETATVGVNIPCASYTGGWADWEWWYIRDNPTCGLTNHTPGGSKFLLAGYILETGSGNPEYWFTPGISLNSGSTYRFSYWYMGDGSGAVGAGTGAYIGTEQTRAAMMPIGAFVYTSAAPFSQYVTDFSVPSDGVYYLGIRANSAWSCGFSIDDLNLIELPLCNTATAATFASGGKATASPSVICSVPGTTTLSLSGVPSFSGLSFSWERSTTSNFSSTTVVGTTTSATNAITVPGVYYYRCKVMCGSTGAFVYSDTVQVQTTPITPPYSETFESVTLGENAPCASATSWSLWGDMFITRGTPIYTSGYTDLINHTSGGTNYLRGGYALSKWSIYPKDYWFTPGIDLTAGNTYEFSYWYLPDNVPLPNTLGAYVGTSQDDWAMNPLIPDFSPSNSTYQQVTASYTPSSSGVYYFGIYVQGSTWYGVAIDDVGVNQLPPCAGKPSSGGIASVTPTMLCTPGSATFFLSSTPRAANLSYEWWECDATGKLVSMASAADISPVFVSGTISSTKYFRCIVACTLGGATDTTYSSVVKIDAVAITPPYIETFETGKSGVNMPCASYTYFFGEDWTWNLMTSPFTPWLGATMDNHTKFGSKYLLGGSDLGLWSGAPEFWFSPAIKLITGNLYQLSFWYQTDGQPGTTYDIKAFIGAVQDRDSMSTTIGAPISTTTKVYQEFKERFTATATGNFYIGIQKSQTNWGGGVAIDDIGLQEVPPCSAPVVAGAIYADLRHICSPGGTAVLDLMGSTLATGLTYEWLSANSPTGPFITTGGTTLPYTTDPLYNTTWFKAIVKCTASGISDTSDGFKIGVGGFDLPYTEDFESTRSDEVPLCSDATIWGAYWNGWNVCNNRAIGGAYINHTTGGKNFLIGGYELGSPISPSEDNYWFTPGLNMRSGYKYSLSFYYLCKESWSTIGNKFGVYFGKSQTVGGMTTNLIPYRDFTNTSYELYDTTFTMTSDGVYYFGFRKSGSDPTSDYGYYGAAFDDINLNYAPCDGLPFAGNITSSKPSGTQYCIGSPLKLTDIGATISLVPGIKYQWQRKSLTTATSWSNVMGATDTVLIADTLIGYEYRLAVICGNTSDTAWTPTFLVPQHPPAPPVTISPTATPISFCLGDTVRFNATNFLGATYDWMLDSVIVPGWKFSDMGATEPGTYMVKVTSGLSPCPSYSNQVNLVRNDPGYTVEITKPTDSIICAGSLMLITGAASKTGVTYQWRKNNVPIPGATSSTYLVSSTGYYRLTANDGISSCAAISRNLLITVQPNPPAIITVPGGTTTACAEIGVRLDANIGGYSYQWLRSGTTIFGWSDSSQIITNSGTYTVKVRTSDGCVNTSAPVNVNILPSPSPIISRSGMVLSVTPTTYVNYQWIRNGKDMTGETSTSLALTMKGLHQVRVTDANGCTGVSTPIDAQDEELNINNPTVVNDAIKIYPNPTNGIVSIESPVALNIEVKDMTGKTVLNIQNAKEVDLEKFADGVYLFIIRDKDEFIKQQRIIKTSR